MKDLHEITIASQDSVRPAGGPPENPESLVVPGEVMSLQTDGQPYELVDGRVKFLCLRATQNRVEFRPPQKVGQLLLALGVGPENGKGLEQITQELYPEAEVTMESDDLAKLIARTNDLTRHIGPPIITSTIKRVNRHYYDPDRAAWHANDFEDWDNDQTYFRFYREAGYLIASYGGLRRGVKLRGVVKKMLLEYFLRHPNEEVETDTIYELLKDTSEGQTRQLATNAVRGLHRTFHNGLGFSDPSLLLSCQMGSKKGVRGRYGIYTLHAHSAELKEDSFVPEGMYRIRVDEQDAALAALGLFMKTRIIWQDLPRAFQQIWPKSTELTALIDLLTPNNRNLGARQLVENKVPQSLERIMTTLRQPDAKAILGEWSPSNGHVKAFVAFLARLDEETATVDQQPVRGLDAILHFLRAARPVT